MKARRLPVLILVAALVLSMVSACSPGSAPAATTAPAATPAVTTPAPATTAKQTEAPKPDFPKKSIEIIVPFNAGASVDNSIRIMAACAEPYLNGQKIIVNNKPGGNASVGQLYVAKADPDGYTLIALTNSFISNITAQDTEMTVDSFEPIMQYCFDPVFFMAHIDAPFNTPEELVAYGKDHEISHVTSGFGTAHHVASLLLEKRAGFKLFKQIHMTGGSEASAQVAGGHIMGMFTSYGTNIPLLEQGKLKVIGFGGTERDSRYPDIPTFREYGYDVAYGAWRGIAAPAGTPKEIIDLLAEAFTKALDEGGAREKLDAIDIPIYYRNTEEFKKHVQTEFVLYKDEALPLLEAEQKAGS